MLDSVKKKLAIFFSHDRRFSLPDKTLWLVVGLIVVFGLVMLISSSAVVAYNKYHNPYYYFNKQIFWLVLGLIAFWIGYRWDYRQLQRLAYPMLIVSIVLLVLTLIPGISKVVNGSRSWLNLGFFGFQPSEFVKLTLLIYLSALLAGNKSQSDEEKRKKIVPFFIILGVIAALMMAQPDIGTLFIIVISALTVFFVFGGKIRNLIYLSAAILIAALSYFAITKLASGSGEKSYLEYRFACLINPQISPTDQCYQINQSLIAIGSGGVFGRGIGNSRQKYLYLPEVQNDFIFAIIAEESGLLISGPLIILFLIFFYRGFIIAKSTEDQFGKNLAIGIATWISLQAILNIGGSINILPMTGVPLPFISAGGSSLLSALAAVGIMSNISTQIKA